MLTKIDFVVQKIHITIKYAFYFAVHNLSDKLSHVLSRGCRCFNLYIAKAAWNCCILLFGILLYWVTQTSHGEFYLSVFLLYKRPCINYLSSIWITT